MLEPYPDYELDYITVNGNVIEGTSFIMPASDVEIYVAFKPVQYAITYVLFGGEVSQDNPDYYTVETIYYLEEYLCPPEKEGYEFIGWYFDEDFSIPLLSYSFPYEEFRPITLYACYYETENEEDIGI